MENSALTSAAKIKRLRPALNAFWIWLNNGERSTEAIAQGFLNVLWPLMVDIPPTYFALHIVNPHRRTLTKILVQSAEFFGSAFNSSLEGSDLQSIEAEINLLKTAWKLDRRTLRTEMVSGEKATQRLGRLCLWVNQRDECALEIYIELLTDIAQGNASQLTPLGVQALQIFREVLTSQDPVTIFALPRLQARLKAHNWLT